MCRRWHVKPAENPSQDRSPSIFGGGWGTEKTGEGGGAGGGGVMMIMTGRRRMDEVMDGWSVIDCGYIYRYFRYDWLDGLMGECIDECLC